LRALVAGGASAWLSARCPAPPQDRKTLPVFFFTDLATGEPFGSNPLPDPSTSVS